MQTFVIYEIHVHTAGRLFVDVYFLMDILSIELSMPFEKFPFLEDNFILAWNILKKDVVYEKYFDYSNKGGNACSRGVNFLFCRPRPCRWRCKIRW